MVLTAWCHLLAFWVALRTRPYPQVAQKARIPLGNHPGIETKILTWCVGAAAGTHIVRARCLERSLTLQRLLRKQGVPANLQIGVRSEGDSIAAHAWIEIEGRPIAEPEDIDQRFVPLETLQPRSRPPRSISNCLK